MTEPELRKAYSDKYAHIPQLHDFVMKHFDYEFAKNHDSISLLYFANWGETGVGYLCDQLRDIERDYGLDEQKVLNVFLDPIEIKPLSELHLHPQDCEKVFKLFFDTEKEIRSSYSDSSTSIVCCFGSIEIDNDGTVHHDGYYNPWDFIKLIDSLGYEPEKP